MFILFAVEYLSALEKRLGKALRSLGWSIARRIKMGPLIALSATSSNKEVVADDAAKAWTWSTL